MRNGVSKNIFLQLTTLLFNIKLCSNSKCLQIIKSCHNFSLTQLFFVVGQEPPLHIVEKREIYSHRCFSVKSTFYLVSVSVKTLLSRKFRQKSVRRNFCNFHTVLLPRYFLNHQKSYFSQGICQTNLIRAEVLVLLIIFRQIDMNFFLITRKILKSQ